MGVHFFEYIKIGETSQAFRPPGRRRIEIVDPARARGSP